MLRYCLSAVSAIGIGLVFVANESVSDQAERGAKSRVAEPKAGTSKPSPKERWAPDENRTWRWYKRETRIDHEWKLTGITTPVHKETGESYTAVTGYLDESVVPIEIRRRGHGRVDRSRPEDGDGRGQADASRRERGGRPPSEWLRSLSTAELREWLKTIDVPEAGVEGTTYFEHLTRDHSFDAEKIEGLTEDEQAKLHAAAHYGY